VKRETAVRARYEEIALDLARRIAQGDLSEGARVLGRSSLAGTYSVSPETIRRAVAILHERGVVQSVAGSGIRVLSRNAAQAYLETVHMRTGLEEGARELRALLTQRRQLDEKIEATLERLMTQATGAMGSRHVEEVAVLPGTWVEGKSLRDIRRRNTTGATVVAVSRGEQDQFSPEPDMLLEQGDVLTLTGSDSARSQARKLLESMEGPTL
jgi:K+/H+ antiporter YhaU regulatory subunit KhtT